jgi:hypothetical protein
LIFRFLYFLRRGMAAIWGAVLSYALDMDALAGGVPLVLCIAADVIFVGRAPEFRLPDRALLAWVRNADGGAPHDRARPFLSFKHFLLPAAVFAALNAMSPWLGFGGGLLVLATALFATLVLCIVSYELAAYIRASGNAEALLNRRMREDADLPAEAWLLLFWLPRRVRSYIAFGLLTAIVLVMIPGIVAGFAFVVSLEYSGATRSNSFSALLLLSLMPACLPFFLGMFAWNMLGWRLRRIRAAEAAALEQSPGLG